MNNVYEKHHFLNLLDCYNAFNDPSLTASQSITYDPIINYEYSLVNPIGNVTGINEDDLRIHVTGTRTNPYSLENFESLRRQIDAIETYNDRVVLVRFKDGTFTKADRGSGDDTPPFDFDMLFTIAILKRMLSAENGSKYYHKLIDFSHKKVAAQEREKMKAAEEKERRKAAAKKRKDKINRKIEKARAEFREDIGTAIASEVERILSKKAVEPDE